MYTHTPIVMHTHDLGFHAMARHDTMQDNVKRHGRTCHDTMRHVKS